MPLLKPTPNNIAAAAEHLRAGQLIAFPTETVYGLGADATNGEAVARIFEAKGRPRFNPLIAHIPGLEAARNLGAFDETAEKLANVFWPGALTLVVPRQPDCPAHELVSAGLATIALRAPAHPIARELLEAAGCPIAAPSANRSESISPTQAVHVEEELGSNIAAILDGGPCPLGIESTVCGVIDGRLYLLRKGAITREAIEQVAGPLASAADDEIQSPGQMKRHYAPRTPLRLNAHEPASGEAWLGFGAGPGPAGAGRNLSPSGDLNEAAANLFAYLRELDLAGARAIAVAPIPDHGLGEAINDRLARAAEAPV